MAETPESISYIKLRENEHPIDAVTINGQLPSSFQESGKIVTSISSSSTDAQIPSAKCLYDMIYGGEEQPSNRTLNNFWDGNTIWDGNIIWQ